LGGDFRVGDFFLVSVRFDGDIVLLGGDFLLGVTSTLMMIGGDFLLGVTGSVDESESDFK
jgi:hypothetical protein